MMSNYLHALRGRNIPAYAGRTSAAWRSNNKPQKHPRIRGENSVTRNAHFANVETSPHTRGKPVWFVAVSVMTRNIPAYAGKAACLRWLDRSRWKHPRIRGESQSISRLRLMLLGNIHAYAGKAGFFCSPLNFCQETSPHTRGKLRKSTGA